MFFTFMGKSTETILDTPLLLCSFDPQDEFIGSEREVQKGETGLCRSVANEYGARYTDTLSFEYALVKEDGAPFSAEEQIMVESWLTSPKLSQYLRLYNENGFQNALYCGTFVSTRWKACAGGLAGIIFQFQCSSPYAWQKHELHFDVKDSQSFEFQIYTDEPEEFIYPSIRLCASSSNVGSIQVKLINVTDDEKELSIQAENGVLLCLDCQTGRITDETNGGVIGFENLGWTDAGKIYFPRLLAGDNKIKLETDAGAALEVDMSYLSPLKIVGGWVYDS